MTWYNPTEGTWVVSGEFATSSILAGSGVWIEDAKGSGHLLITYTASGAKVFSSGVLQFSTLMAPAGVVTLADKGTLGSVKYHPRAFTDAEAIALATGDITVSFTLRNVFNNSPQGVWYDPSDTTTLFQDSAGTTPVTASGQPVGLMLDKSKGLARVVNLLTWSEDFGSAAWVKVGNPGGVPTDNGGVTGPGGASGARSFTFAGNTYLRRLLSLPSSEVTTSAVWVKKGAVSPASAIRITTNNTQAWSTGTSAKLALTDAWQLITLTGSLTSWGARYLMLGMVQADGTADPDCAGSVEFWHPQTNLGTTALPYQRNDATVGGPGHHATQPTAGSRPIYRRGDSRGVVNQLLNTETLATQSRTVTAVGHTLSFTGTGSITLSGASTAGPLVGTGVNDRVSLTFTPTAGSLTLTVSGSVTKGQLNLGSTALPYQRNDANLGGVATGASTDLHWLETDGVDDSMVTGSIDFTGTDKVSVFAGVRKLSDAATGAVVGTGATGSEMVGGFELFAPSQGGANKFTFGSKASSVQVTTATTSSLYSAPTSAVVSASSDIAGPAIKLRLLGLQVGLATTDQGTGSFGNYPLYLFRRGGVSLPFNGWFYGLAITGRLTTDAETVATERFLAAKSAVVIP